QQTSPGCAIDGCESLGLREACTDIKRAFSRDRLITHYSFGSVLANDSKSTRVWRSQEIEELVGYAGADKALRERLACEDGAAPVSDCHRTAFHQAMFR